MEITMTREQALAKMTEIDNQMAILREAHSRLNLIAAGVIESKEEIALQSGKIEQAVALADLSAVKEAVEAAGLEADGGDENVKA